ncbi:hypothetical protein ACF3NT_14640 [Naumannella halotolerans]|uniref:hypothetical protein n=1 Tax=Naumannella halotolerans TaxID=993414 RepID=UPI00370D46B0
MPQASLSGEVRIELPFAARPSRLVNSELGIDKVTVLGGPTDRWTRQETLLDAADFRLVRAGIVLTHRVSDGRGDWNLSAPGWHPWLPADRSEPMSDGDLPDELASLIRPFRRDAPLTPVAALEVDNWTYALQSAGERITTVTDKFVTVRSGGLTTSRFREVTVGAGLNTEQREWVIEILGLAGGTQVEEFVSLAGRIGAPATGRTDFPAPAPWDDHSRIDVVIGSLLAARLQMIITADLALRGGGPADPLIEQLTAVATELRGLAPFLRHPSSLPEDYIEIAERLRAADPDEALTVINSGRHLKALDTLIRSVRAPRLVDGIDTDQPPKARDAFGGLLERVCLDFVEACDRLSPESDDEAWQAAVAAGGQLINSAAITQMIKPKRSKRVRRATKSMLAELRQSIIDSSPPEIDRLSPAEAFEAGRSFERADARRQAARARAVALWSSLRGEFR